VPYSLAVTDRFVPMNNSPDAVGGRTDFNLVAYFLIAEKENKNGNSR